VYVLEPLLSFGIGKKAEGGREGGREAGRQAGRDGRRPVYGKLCRVASAVGNRSCEG